MLGANTIYTLASVPLALHYLPRKAFGLWALVMQVTSYLMLIDLGMSASICRILIDHKDNQETGAYGSIIKTGCLVLTLQGLIILVLGAVSSIWLPELFAVPQIYRRDFQMLVIGLCAVMGVTLGARVFGHILQAHQRYDPANYSQVGGFVINFVVMWVTFAAGWGLYSLLAGYVAATLFNAICNIVAVMHLNLFPPREARGRVSLQTFYELFSFAREVFLVSVGSQLVSASQIMVISRTLGLDMAAVWSVATKPFTMAQQAVFRLGDYSYPALAEMIVRREKERFLARFRDLVILSTSLAVWAGLAMAVCNRSFLVLWTKGLISWGRSSDVLMMLVVIVGSSTRCYISVAGLAKEIRFTKYIYFCEGACFVGSSLLLAPSMGINGVLLCSLITNVLCTGAYGVMRVRDYFRFAHLGPLLAWLARPLWFLLSCGAGLAALAWCTGGRSPRLQFATDFAAVVLVGGPLFWQLGLNRDLRAEAVGFLGKVSARIRVSFPGRA
jgi:O-antigen/teichoic acid export membrane protein